ncbi:hypothetical protein DYB34_012349, partial [Aphanomyces astaci]
VVNRLIPRTVKTLTSKLKQRATDWDLAMNLIQGTLNHMLYDRLRGMAPVTYFTGLSVATCP